MKQRTLEDFVVESWEIEGLKATDKDVETHVKFLKQPLRLFSVVAFQETIAPGKGLRTNIWDNVRVGNHTAPTGGNDIILALEAILGLNISPFLKHHWLLHLHPFSDGNGRTARAIWLYETRDLSMPFLQRWYYETLAYMDGAR